MAAYLPSDRTGGQNKKVQTSFYFFLLNYVLFLQYCPPRSATVGERSELGRQIRGIISEQTCRRTGLQCGQDFGRGNQRQRRKEEFIVQCFGSGFRYRTVSFSRSRSLNRCKRSSSHNNFIFLKLYIFQLSSFDGKIMIRIEIFGRIRFQ